MKAINFIVHKMKNMRSKAKAATLGALKESGYQLISVKDELRKNLLKKLENREEIFEGIIGYEHTVAPGIINAILSRHDFILLGQRGQAKSRILRQLTSLLDEETPIIKGSEVNDNPFAPVSKAGMDALLDHGDDVEIEWIGREQRYGEKLATPDVTISDLIGDIDPIKAAVNRLHYSHEGVIHFGIIPRTNRGIFTINELPDLQPRIQVGLFNLMQEKDIQIRGFPVRIPIDILMVYSANPEDYTNRGNIITPLKDRIGSQILTHYPKDVATGLKITSQESWVERGNRTVQISDLLREIIELTAIEARKSEFIDQMSGVSARLTIALLENIISNAERRAFICSEDNVQPRVCDLFASLSAVTGKIELVYEGEQEGVVNVAKGLLGKACKHVFLKYCVDPYKAAKSGTSPFAETIGHFKAKGTVEISDSMTAADYSKALMRVRGLENLADSYFAETYADDPALKLTAMEFILEGLHQNSMLSKDEVENRRVYGDMLQRMFSDLDDET